MKGTTFMIEPVIPVFEHCIHTDTEVLKRAGMKSISEIGTVKMDRPCYQNA